MTYQLEILDDGARAFLACLDDLKRDYNDEARPIAEEMAALDAELEAFRRGIEEKKQACRQKVINLNIKHREIVRESANMYAATSQHPDEIKACASAVNLAIGGVNHDSTEFNETLIHSRVMNAANERLRIEREIAEEKERRGALVL